MVATETCMLGIELRALSKLQTSSTNRIERGNLRLMLLLRAFSRHTAGAATGCRKKKYVCIINKNRKPPTVVAYASQFGCESAAHLIIL